MSPSNPFSIVELVNCYSRRCRNASLVFPNDTEPYKLTYLGIVCIPKFLFGIVLLTTSAVVMSIITILLPPIWLSHKRSRSEIKKTPPFHSKLSLVRMMMQSWALQ